MYIVVDKKTKTVLHVNPIAVNDDLTEAEIYADFDPNTMLIGKSDATSIPSAFEIDDNGKIIQLSNADASDSGPDEEVLSVALEAPFETMVNGTLVIRSLEQLLEDGALTTVADCQKALDREYETIETEIAKHYPPSREMKLTKAYTVWIDEGKPADDKRVREYLEMEAYIDTVKGANRAARTQLKELLATLQEREHSAILTLPVTAANAA